MQIEVRRYGQYRRWYHIEFRTCYEATIRSDGWEATASGTTARQATRRAKRKLDAAQRVQAALNKAKGNDTDRLAGRVLTLEHRATGQVDLSASLVAQADGHRQMIEALQQRVEYLDGAQCRQLAVNRNLVRGLDLSDSIAREALTAAKRRNRAK